MMKIIGDFAIVRHKGLTLEITFYRIEKYKGPMVYSSQDNVPRVSV